MCTVNKSVHTKKVWKLIECTSYIMGSHLGTHTHDMDNNIAVSYCFVLHFFFAPNNKFVFFQHVYY